MGCGFWGMNKGKAAAERVMLNIRAPPSPRVWETES